MVLATQGVCGSSQHVPGNPPLGCGLMLVRGSVDEKESPRVGGDHLERVSPLHRDLILLLRLEVASRHHRSYLRLNRFSSPMFSEQVRFSKLTQVLRSTRLAIELVPGRE